MHGESVGVGKTAHSLKKQGSYTCFLHFQKWGKGSSSMLQDLDKKEKKKILCTLSPLRSNIPLYPYYLFIFCIRMVADGSRIQQGFCLLVENYLVWMSD